MPIFMFNQTVIYHITIMITFYIGIFPMSLSYILQQTSIATVKTSMYAFFNIFHYTSHLFFIIRS